MPNLLPSVGLTLEGPLLELKPPPKGEKPEVATPGLPLKGEFWFRPLRSTGLCCELLLLVPEDFPVASFLPKGENPLISPGMPFRGVTTPPPLLVEPLVDPTPLCPFQLGDPAPLAEKGLLNPAAGILPPVGPVPAENPCPSLVSCWVG